MALALLLAQDPDIVLSVERERMAASNQHSGFELVEIVARHQDGTPARGTIACSGWWFKFQDDGKNTVYQEGQNLPFVTDSRGAIVMNPMVGEYAEDMMTCTALDVHGHKGSISFTTPTAPVEIVVR